MPAAGALLVADRNARLARMGQAVPVAGIERHPGLRALDIRCQTGIDHQGRRRDAVDRGPDMDLRALVRAAGAREERVAGLCPLLSSALDAGGLGLVLEEDLCKGLTAYLLRATTLVGRLTAACLFIVSSGFDPTSFMYSVNVTK